LAAQPKRIYKDKEHKPLGRHYLDLTCTTMSFEVQSSDLRVHTEWRLPISGVHPIMMEKSALAGEGEGCTATPFQSITITYKVEVYASAERADTLTLFPLSPSILLGSDPHTSESNGNRCVHLSWYF
jgi:hypothetical protein